MNESMNTLDSPSLSPFIIPLRSRQIDRPCKRGKSPSRSCFASLQHLRSLLASVAFFAITTPLGSVIGVIVTNESSSSASLQGGEDYQQTPIMQLIVGFLQALACGTFFYVTFFEILPKEINDEDEDEEGEEDNEEEEGNGGRGGNHGCRWSGWNRLTKILSIIIGFVCVALMIKFIGNGCIDDDEDNDGDDDSDNYASSGDKIRKAFG